MTNRKRIAATVAFTILAVLVGPQAAEGANSVSMKVFVSGYGWHDNTPPGSAAISHPQIHKKAGGTGTYTNPITVAVGHSIIGGKDKLDFPAGTIFYIKGLKRYFIVEDTCGDGPRPQDGACHTGYPSRAKAWLDVWIGGKTLTARQAEQCMNDITKVYTVIKNAPSGYEVQAGEIARKGC